MSTINKYESLKTEGTWNDSIHYVLSLSDKNELENFLKQSASYEDVKMFIFLSKSTKNEKNLLQLFKTDTFPIQQRAIAGKSWLKLQCNEQQIHDFIVEMVNDKNIPRFLKNQILENLHRIDCLKHSPTFFYNLTSHLTESIRHDQYNLNAHLVPFCSRDQILILLSRWSIERFEQIPSPSLFRSKLIQYQPSVVIDLIVRDVNERKGNQQKLIDYFRMNNYLLSSLAKTQTRAICRLTMDYLHQLEKHRRFLPEFIHSKQKYFFKKVPDEMIEIITIVGSNRPGMIKYHLGWGDDGYDVGEFSFPRSFSLQHYIRLFLALYNTCQWSSNYTIPLFQYMLKSRHQHSGRSSLRKQRKWVLDIIIDQHIGRERFIEKLLIEGDETTLQLFEEYSEITTPLSLHLISQSETNRTLSTKQRLTFLRYQTMTDEIFNQLLALSSQTNSNINQREQNYLLFLQCALSTSDEQVTRVLQWIAERFVNERLKIIESFLHRLKELIHRFQLECLPDKIETIIQLALNHRQQSTYTLQIIFEYALKLLQTVEHYRNEQIKENIQTFALRIIQQCFAKNDASNLHIQSFSESYPIARHRLADLFVSDLFPKLLSKSLIDELTNFVNYSLEKSWRLSQIDTFLQKFFLDELPSSNKLQSAFRIDTHSSMISIFLKNRSTQHERLSGLINKFHRVFLLNKTVQRIIVRSDRYRSFVDQLLEDEKCLTVEKLTNEQTKFITNLQSSTKNLKFPGFDIPILNSSFCYLTGKQQQYLTKIILHDYLQDKEVTNPKKLKSLRVLPRFIHTHSQSLQWFKEKQRSPGVNTDPLDPLIICLPVRFDLSLDGFLEQLNFLKTKLNASNAKYISDTMRMISHRISERIFLEQYLQFVQSEYFQSCVGITANKEILRLLTEYSSDSSLIRIVIEPLWTSRPHPDVRASLVLTLLYFLENISSTTERNIIWKILEEAADDVYLPVVQSLFADYRGSSHWPLTRSINSSNEIYQNFVNRIQFRILDHPSSSEARLWAWTNIDDEHCDISKLIGKGKQLCIQFNRNANMLWEKAFQQILATHKQRKISSFDVVMDIIQTLMAYRQELDSKENGIDNQHDLPVYHRIHRMLTMLIAHVQSLDNQIKLSFRPLAAVLLEFDKTFALLIGTLLIKIAQHRDDLQSMLVFLEENLSEDYFERIVIQLAIELAKSSSGSFIQQLDVHGKLQLAQWFIEEHDRGLFVFDLLKAHVFSHSGDNREQCQNLLRRMRESENFVLRQQALAYTVKWKRKKERHERKIERTNGPRVTVNPDEMSMDLFDIFNAMQ